MEYMFKYVELHKCIVQQQTIAPQEAVLPINLFWIAAAVLYVVPIILMWQDAVSHLLSCEFYKIILCRVMGDFLLQGSSESKSQDVRMVQFQADGCSIIFCFMWQTNAYTTKCPGSQSAYW
jgi:hypothetical protein